MKAIITIILMFPIFLYSQNRVFDNIDVNNKLYVGESIIYNNELLLSSTQIQSAIENNTSDLEDRLDSLELVIDSIPTSSYTYEFINFTTMQGDVDGIKFSEDSTLYYWTVLPSEVVDITDSIELKSYLVWITDAPEDSTIVVKTTNVINWIEEPVWLSTDTTSGTMQDHNIIGTASNDALTHTLLFETEVPSNIMLHQTLELLNGGETTYIYCIGILIKYRSKQ